MFSFTADVITEMFVLSEHEIREDVFIVFDTRKFVVFDTQKCLNGRRQGDIFLNAGVFVVYDTRKLVVFDIQKFVMFDTHNCLHDHRQRQNLKCR